MFRILTIHKRASVEPSGVQPIRPAGKASPSVASIPGYELFELRGDNWLNAPEKPIAILWGFMPWKRDFVTEYLGDYRVAFARGNTAWARLEKALNALQESISFIIWSYTEKPCVREYAEQHGLPIIRMEDGFIRSAVLGSQHSTAYSLVMDRTGLYFNAESPSDIENLLNTYDFSSAHKLVGAAQPLMRLYRGLGISKYNLGRFKTGASVLGPKLKKRVLVVGQVEGDASIKYGLATEWTCRKLIELAVVENPAAEIIYRPHPDVVQGFRNNSDELSELQTMCRVIEEDIRLAELIGLVDHVYVITSLSGMEALIHGVPVTVVGAPFYAGWGLTDDRQDIPRRARKLTLDELFCGAYLLYPKYLADLVDPVVGCLATMLRISAERRIKLEALPQLDSVVAHAAAIAGSEHWPILFKPEIIKLLKEKNDKKLLSEISVARMFSYPHGPRYKTAIAYFVAGQLRSTRVFEKALAQIRPFVGREIYRRLIIDLWRTAPSAVVLSQWALCCEQSGEIEAARSALEFMAFKAEYKKDGLENEPLLPKDFSHHLRLAQFEFGCKNFERAEQIFLHLLLSGCMLPDVLIGLGEIAWQKFDFSSAAALLDMASRLNPEWKQGSLYLRQALMYCLAELPIVAIESLTMACVKHPPNMAGMGGAIDALGRKFGSLPYSEAILRAVGAWNPANPVGNAQVMIAHERPVEAEAILSAYTPKMAEAIKYGLTLSNAYSYQGKLHVAKELVCSLLQHTPGLLIYREGLRLSILMNDYQWGGELLAEAEGLGLDVGDIYQRKIFLGMGKIKDSYSTFKKMKAGNLLKKYIKGKYVQSLNDLQEGDGCKGLILGFFGPGDEIRFASLYREMYAGSGKGKAAFTCDPRLNNLLRRHYSELEFIPCSRVRNLAWLEDYDHIDKIPGAELHAFFDNNGWAAVQAADKVTLVTDILGDLIEGYDSFRGEPYLKADPILVDQWFDRLEGCGKKTIWIGLSWRSGVTSFARNEHYLSVESLAPLFDIEGINFVNLQYDDCDDELSWLETHFPGRVVNFEDLDQFNDLEGVAALMECLDLVIAPATTVMELAGALGRPTLLLSNSSELHWRKLPGTTKDAWHHSVQHIDAPVLGDKDSLVRAVALALKNRVDSEILQTEVIA
ncbi:capsular polysaccharide export protein, LipB/KpsS family [Chitiniphilus shinanonensis]|uniref:capsular polysaccharide export protein, LipB/KpsS family n=1 Tax=Chitiniphilus shinanonensis TaxID=553088 RepID=UPI00302B6E44